MHMCRRRRDRVSSQVFSPPLVWHDSRLVDDDGEQHADRREWFTAQASNSHGDSWMSRDRGEGEDGTVIFIGPAEEVAGDKSADRNDHDGGDCAQRAFANDRRHAGPAQDREPYETEKKQTSAGSLKRRTPSPRGRKEAANHQPDAEREQELSDRHFGDGERVTSTSAP